MRAEQDVGGVGVYTGIADVAAFIRERRMDPAHGTAERHARAVGVDHTGSPALRIQLAVADTAGLGGIAQTFVVVQVGTADFERTGRVVDAGHPGAVLTIVLQAAVVGRVDNAKAELLPVDFRAEVPLMEGVVLVGSIHSRVLNVGVTATGRDTDFLPLAFIPQRAFPGIAVVAGHVLDGNAKGRRGFVGARRTAERQQPGRAQLGV